MSSIACLPITALHMLEIAEKHLLISGSGSTLSIYDVDGVHEVLPPRRIFPCQAIHGIISGEPEKHRAASSILVCAWGGKQLCLANLILQSSAVEDGAVEITLDLQPPIEAGDWILDAVFDASKSMIVLLTAHNNLKIVQLLQPATDSCQRISSLCDGPQTLLYSGHVLSTSSDSLLVASGTVFGETVVWTCSRQDARDPWTACTRHLFLGHQGSVFGVRLSKPINFHGSMRRLLASCSDDRSIRIWDVSDCDLATPSREVEVHSRQTGFGTWHSQTSELTMAWGHLSRIWSVHFPSIPFNHAKNILELHSCGEDGVYQSWEINKKNLFDGKIDGVSVMHKTSHDRHHTGKNVWSYAQGVVGSSIVVFTGAADGQIVARSTLHDNCETSHNQVASPFRRVLRCLDRDAVSQPGRRPSTAKYLKQYLSCPDGTVVATTDSGQLLVSRISDCDQWHVVDNGTPGHVITLCSNQNGDLVFYSQSNGSLKALNILDRTVTQLNHSFQSQASWKQVIHFANKPQDGSQISYLLVNLLRHEPQLLTIKITMGATDVQCCSVRVPTDFVITSAILDLENKLLICGSRAGALAVFTNVSNQSTEISSAYCKRHVHHDDTVTSIVKLPITRTTDNKDEMFILTTGRDATFACHAVMNIRDAVAIKINTVHESYPPLGPCIEGAYLSERQGGQPALLLYGFKSKDFIVWDETHQTNLLTIDCGGVHRNWTYTPSASHDRIGMLMWTKAGSFNAYEKGVVQNLSLKLGSHGREIKALAISPASACSMYGLCQGARIIATGAEDTDIRIFKYGAQATQNNQPSDLSSTTVLKGHNTGLQHLMFSPCGRFLFSSAGCEELFVWHLHNVPMLTVGAVLVAKLPRRTHNNEPDTKNEFDARIMSFDIVELHNSCQDKVKFNVLMAYSTGKAKLAYFTYTFGDDTATFELINEHVAGSICLTQAEILLNQRQFLIGATDGFLRFLREESMEDTAMTHRVHQSSILALAVQDLTPQIKLVATGGDDNAFGVTVLNYTITDVKPQIRTLLVPDAHAAALTAVAFVRHLTYNGRSLVLVVTAGNDQRVKLWLTTNQSPSESQSQSTLTSKPEHDSRLQMLEERWTDVADISNIEVVSVQDPDGDGVLGFEVLVVGVGMEILGFRISGL